MSDWSARIQREVQERPVKSCRPPFRVGFFSLRCPVAVMGFRVVLLSFLLVSLSCSRGAVITGACERDAQCGFGLCCAVSLWLRGLRMCVPRGVEGDECHPFSHKVPYPGKRQHHTCPCLPHLVCTRYNDNKYRCTDDFKNMDF